MICFCLLLTFFFLLQHAFTPMPCIASSPLPVTLHFDGFFYNMYIEKYMFVWFYKVCTCKVLVAFVPHFLASAQVLYYVLPIAVRSRMTCSILVYLYSSHASQFFQFLHGYCGHLYSFINYFPTVRLRWLFIVFFFSFSYLSTNRHFTNHLPSRDTDGSIIERARYTD